MEPIPLLEKVSSYSLLARLWLLDEPSFFSLAGYDRANNIIVLCYQFSTVAPQVLLSFKTKLAEENKTSLSPAMLLVSRNPISSGPSPVELCRKVEMG